MTRRQPVRNVPPNHPDEAFWYADDVLVLTLREKLGIAAATLIGFAVVMAFCFLMALTPVPA